VKKLIYACIVLVVLILGCVSLASCADDGPFTTTVTPSGGTAVVPTFSVPPPDIPHVYLIVDPGNPYIQGLISETGGAICFECHGSIPQHSIWEDDPNICADCHVVSDNPVLVPR